MRLLNLFLSYKFILLMLALLAAGAGVATFLESIYDTPTAKILVYEARWYELVMLCLSLSLLGVIWRGKMWRKFGAFCLHTAFIVIIIGAFLTRYFGEEGVLHVRAGQSTDEMVSVKPFLQIRSGEQNFEFPLNLAQIGSNDFKFSAPINSKNFIIKFISYDPAVKGERSTLVVEAGFEGQNTNIIYIQGGVGWIGEPAVMEAEGVQVMLSWGSKLVKLPFAIKLVKFELERYAGSQSPSSYASYVEVLDGSRSKILDYKIYMNHPLTYGGAKFFQSSYDTDEMGTVLEVNRDPGKWPTYAGYALLCLGFIANFFTRTSRFAKLVNFIKNSPVALIFALVLALNLNLRADEARLIEFGKFSAAHANGAFGELLVQDYMGRIKPLSTEATEVVSKMSGRTSLFGLSAEQIILGMNLNPNLWQELEIIKLTNPQIKKLLNLPESQSFVSFAFMFDDHGRYKLARESDAANAKPASQRGVLENELIKFDERINIAYLTFRGVFFKFIPVPNDPNDRWLSPNDAFNDPTLSNETKALLNDYLVGLQEGTSANEWQRADAALEKLKEYQRATSSHLLPSSLQIKTEVSYNKILIFKKLVYFYLIFSIVTLVLAFAGVFSGRKFQRAQNLAFWLFALAFCVHTAGLAVRWYISGHAPWSDSYESMIYIGWSAALAGVVFFRRSLLTLCAASLLAFIVMLVAHMSFVNPQITNLVPVLKSYWLMIHVSVITASYGFLGLGCLLGLIALTLMAFKNTKNSANLDAQIRYIAAINEASLIIGLCMLTLGNFFGGIWANESWGRYWGWDSKETWSFVSIVVYVIVLHMRFWPRLNSLYAFLVGSVVAYGSIIMTYFGVNFYLTGMHSYAAGEAPSVPSFIYVIIAFVFVLIALAWRGRDIKTI